MSGLITSCNHDAGSRVCPDCQKLNAIQGLKARVAELETMGKEEWGYRRHGSYTYLLCNGEDRPYLEADNAHVWMSDRIDELEAQVAELKAERDWWEERACQSNKRLHPGSYLRYLATTTD